MDDIQIFHDSHNIQLRNPFGAVTIGTKVRIRIWTSKKCSVYINLINFYHTDGSLQKSLSLDLVNDEVDYSEFQLSEE